MQSVKRWTFASCLHHSITHLGISASPNVEGAYRMNPAFRFLSAPILDPRF